MKVLLVGTGGVGESIAILAKDRPWLERMVLADFNVERATEVRQKVGERNASRWSQSMRPCRAKLSHWRGSTTST